MTALKIANLALLKLKAKPLTSLNDAGYVAELIRDYLVYVSDQIMIEHDWQFARKRAELTENTSVTNLTDYEYAYDLPSDALYPRKLKSGLQYVIEDWILFTGDDSPVLIYTTNCMEKVDADSDPGTPDVPQVVSGISIPRPVEEAIATELAFMLSYKITESVQLQQSLMQQSAIILLRARQRDARMTPGNDLTPRHGIEDGPDWWSDV